MEWLKKIPDWVLGTIILITSIFGLFGLLREDTKLLGLIISVVILGTILILCAYIIFARDKPVFDGKGAHRFPNYRNIAFVGIGVVAGIVAGYLLSKPNRENIIAAVYGNPTPVSATIANENLCEKYDIKILTPKDGDVINGVISITGTYENSPTADDFQIFVRKNSPPYEYWPKERSVIALDSDNNTWIWTGDPGIDQEASTIIVSTLGESGRALTDFYAFVGNSTGQYPGIKTLSPDITECDRVTVQTENK